MNPWSTCLRDPDQHPVAVAVPDVDDIIDNSDPSSSYLADSVRPRDNPRRFQAAKPPPFAGESRFSSPTPLYHRHTLLAQTLRGDRSTEVAQKGIRLQVTSASIRLGRATPKGTSSSASSTLLPQSTIQALQSSCLLREGYFGFTPDDGTIRRGTFHSPSPSVPRPCRSHQVAHFSPSIHHLSILSVITIGIPYHTTSLRTPTNHPSSSLLHHRTRASPPATAFRFCAHTYSLRLAALFT